MNYWYVWCKTPQREGFDGPFESEEEAQNLAMTIKGTVGHPQVVSYPTRDRSRAYGMFRDEYLKTINPNVDVALQRRGTIPEYQKYKAEKEQESESRL